jgi:hypothetical protein
LLLGEAFVYQLGLQRLGGGGTARRLKTRVIDDLTALMQQPALTAYLNDAKAQARHAADRRAAAGRPGGAAARPRRLGGDSWRGLSHRQISGHHKCQLKQVRH